MSDTEFRTVRIYRRATGPKYKRAGRFSTAEAPREEMDVCTECQNRATDRGDEKCPMEAVLHPQEVVIACDYSLDARKPD